MPFFNVLGYLPIGGAISGPRNSTQNTFEEQDSLSWVHGSHAAKFGADLLRMQLNMFQAIAPNAFFIFASTFPTNDAIANLELGAPVPSTKVWVISIEVFETGASAPTRRMSGASAGASLSITACATKARSPSPRGRID